MSQPRVLIVGGGISGLTLAIALRRRHIDAEIVEIKTDPAQQPGVGLSLQGNCLAALAMLGIADACIEAGVPADYLNLRRPDGSLIARQPIMPMGGPAFPGTVGIARDTLHAILLGAATNAGVSLRLGETVENFTSTNDHVNVTFANGSTGQYDLLVGADGAYSRTRAMLFPQVVPAPCGQAVWRAAVPRPEGSLTTELHLGGPLGIVGICPISARAAYVYIVEAASPTTRFAESDLAAAMLEKLTPYGGDLLTPCKTHLKNSSAVSYRHLEWLLLPKPWHHGRVVIIGDAAHCNPPVLAQGAAMGIEDAVALAEAASNADRLEQSLHQFAERRHPRASMVVNNSVQLCQWEVEHSVGPEQVGRLMMESQKALCSPF